MMFFVKLNNFIFFTSEYQLDSENWENAMFRILFLPYLGVKFNYFLLFLVECVLLNSITWNWNETVFYSLNL